MSKLVITALMGAISILLLAGLAVNERPSTPRGNAVALPQVAADASHANAPRECSIANNVTTGCTYQ